VLAIDNEPRILEGMQILLAKWGCEVAPARDLGEARRAMARLGPGAPDVIIADYHLDDGDGVTAIIALREESGVAIPAILATADRSPEARAAAERAGVSIMNKPLKPAPLRAQLSRFGALRAAAE